MVLENPKISARDILHRRYIKDDPFAIAEIEQHKLNVEIAQMIYDLRTNSGITQLQLAKRIGTSQSVISRLEDANYNGHSLSMLNRVARALNKKLQVQFVDVSPNVDLASTFILG